MGAPGAGRTTHVASLLTGSDARLVATDTVFVRYQGGEALADVPERKLYLTTDFVTHFPRVADLFESCKLENVATRREECTNDTCPDQDVCQIDRGVGFCFKAHGAGRAMLDPYWLGGPGRHSRRTKVRWVVLMRRDPVGAAVERPDSDAALRLLEAGVAGPAAGAAQPKPWFHPHLLGAGAERHDLVRRQFQTLLKTAPLYVVNTAAGSREAVQARLKDIVAGRV
jgi:hypothetical protein